MRVRPPCAHAELLVSLPRTGYPPAPLARARRHALRRGCTPSANGFIAKFTGGVTMWS